MPPRAPVCAAKDKLYGEKRYTFGNRWSRNDRDKIPKLTANFGQIGRLNIVAPGATIVNIFQT